jgi:hypothetical protein
MFVVDEDTAAAIRAAMADGGEFSAAVELRRRFPGIQDNAKARTLARMIAGWPPGPDLKARVTEARNDLRSKPKMP